MKLSHLTFLVFLSIAVGCGSSKNNNADGAADRPDGAKVVDAADLSTDHPTDMADGAVDRPVDQVPDIADVADAADGPGDVSSDSVDGAIADVPPGTLPQRLAPIILVSDPVGVDGGADGDADGAGDSGAPEGGPSVDPNLVNAWGLAFNPTGPLWVADNHTGLSTVYNALGQAQSLVVTIPAADGGTPPAAPTGLVFNPTAAAFMGDHFIFSSEDGTITGWQTGTAAALRADNSPAMAIYKGLALGTQNGVSRLYATDFHNGKVDVFDQSYAKVTTTGGFSDPTLPAGFAPFGIQAMGATIYVTYAQQDDMAEDDSPGPGKGFVDVFTFDGALQKRLISRGALNSPWAVALAPANFGGWANALIVGNFGDGHINAYNPNNGSLLGTALDPGGLPLTIDGLWALVFGNGTAGAAANQLFFTAGPMMEQHGQLGRLDVVP